MKFGATITAFSTVLAIIYGVIFSITYPLVPVSSGIVSLCALCGLASCLAIMALWKFVTGPRST